MTMETFAVNLHLFIAVGSLGLLWFCWRGYRIDALRENLFVLRQELFDYAAMGSVPFDHKAYFFLRVRINGMIRFAHRVSFARLAVSLVFSTCANSEVLMKHQKEWREAVDGLQPSVRERLNEIDRQMSTAVVKHMVLGSPVLIGIVALIVPVAIVTGLAMQLWRSLAGVVPGLEFLEAQALAEQTA